MMELNRGDICLVNFNPAKGGEIGKFRPAIVLSDREENEILNTVIVILYLLLSKRTLCRIDF